MSSFRHPAALAAMALAAGLPAIGQSQRAPGDPPLARQREICFPASAPARCRQFASERIAIWTDAPVDGDELLAHLAKVEQYLAGIFPAPTAASAPAGPASAPAARGPVRPVALAVYDRPPDYQALWRRVGEYYAGVLPEVVTAGYSYRVFCAASFESKEKFAQRRPVLCHEFAHVWLYQNAGLRNDGNWLTEGLGTAVQLKFFPASGDRKEFARYLEAGQLLPLKRLMDSERVATKDYWQAGTLVELLIQRHGDRLPGVVAAFNKGASAYAIVKDALDMDFDTLQKQWAEYVRAGAKRN